MLKEIITIEKYQIFNPKAGSKFEFYENDDDGKHVIFMEIPADETDYITYHKVRVQDADAWFELCNQTKG